MNLLLPLLVLLLLAPPAEAAGKAERDYRQARESYRKLAASSRDRLYRDNWNRAIDRLLKVQRTYPRHQVAAAAGFLAGKAGRDLWEVSRRPEDASRAAALFESMAESYPASSLADDALLLAGGLYEEVLVDLPRAYACYRQTAEKYPKGDMAPRARQKLVELARYAPPSPASAASADKSALAVSSAAGSAPAASRAELSGVRFWSNPGYTRVVLDFSGPVDYTANFLAGDPQGGTPPRLYVDVRRAVPGAGLAESTQVEDGLLRQIRTGRYGAETVRVVLDLVSIQDYKVFPLADPQRIVLDVTGDRPADPEAIGASPVAPSSAGEKDAIGGVLAQAPEERSLSVQIPAAPVNAVRRIVIDPGHGGKDPGAIGPTGLMEKEVTLNLAKVLARQLKETIGCEVILTRSGDVFLPLEERTAIANRVGADLFISVHANAAPNREAYGVETYYLNFSKNDKAAAVAARENGTSLKQVGDLELILFDLMANSKINESSRLAAEIQKSLIDDLGRHFTQVKDLGVRQGPFYVLLGATMPSVLVEAAFISHPREETRLTDSRYHEKTAAAIVRAVQQYANSLRMIASQ